MEDSLKRNIVKVGLFAGIAWIGYNIVKGFSKNKSPSEIVKETVAPIENAAAEVKKVTKKFLKGSPEAKKFMAEMRAKNHTPRGQGKRALRRKSKAAAGKIGGDKTADLGEHKGHSTKKGLAQDQNKSSQEVHEKHYRKNKKTKDNFNEAIAFEIIRNDTSLKGDEIMKAQRLFNEGIKSEERFFEIIRNDTSLKGDEIMKAQRLYREKVVKKN